MLTKIFNTLSLLQSSSETLVCDNISATDLFEGLTI
jgi:hypothetical protein